MTISSLKMMVKNGLEFFYIEIERAPSKILANLSSQANSAFLGGFFCKWQQQLFSSLFQAQNGHFKSLVPL